MSSHSIYAPLRFDPKLPWDVVIRRSRGREIAGDESGRVTERLRKKSGEGKRISTEMEEMEKAESRQG